MMYGSHEVLFARGMDDSMVRTKTGSHAYEDGSHKVWFVRAIVRSRYGSHELWFTRSPSDSYEVWLARGMARTKTSSHEDWMPIIMYDVYEVWFARAMVCTTDG